MILVGRNTMPCVPVPWPLKWTITDGLILVERLKQVIRADGPPRLENEGIAMFSCANLRVYVASLLVKCDGIRRDGI